MIYTWTKNVEKSSCHDRHFPVIVKNELSQCAKKASVTLVMESSIACEVVSASGRVIDIDIGLRLITFFTGRSRGSTSCTEENVKSEIRFYWVYDTHCASSWAWEIVTKEKKKKWMNTSCINKYILHKQKKTETHPHTHTHTRVSKTKENKHTQNNKKKASLIRQVHGWRTGAWSSDMEVSCEISQAC